MHNLMEPQRPSISEQQGGGGRKSKHSETEIQWAKDKVRHKVDKRRRKYEKGGRAGVLGWKVNGPVTTRHPSTSSLWLQSTHPSSIRKPSSAFCSTLLTTPLFKTSSPAIPLALARAATSIIKGPEEMEVVTVGLHCACVYLCTRICAEWVWQICSICPIGSADSPVAPTCPFPSSRSKGRRKESRHGLDIYQLNSPTSLSK